MLVTQATVFLRYTHRLKEMQIGTLAAFCPWNHDYGSYLAESASVLKSYDALIASSQAGADFNLPKSTQRQRDVQLLLCTTAYSVEAMRLHQSVGKITLMSAVWVH